MTDYSDVKYCRDFLQQVVVRFDFAEFLDTGHVFDDKVERAIRVSFGHRGKNQIMRFNMLNVVLPESAENMPDTSRKIVEGFQREYFSDDGKNRVVLSNKFLIFEIKDYDSYETLRDNIQRIISALYSAKRITVVREGVRYINMYDQSHIKLRKNYFTTEIAASLVIKLPLNVGDFSAMRSLHTTEFRTESMKLRFTYGMYNPEYPSTLRMNNFLLDYDCYTQEPLKYESEILGCLDQGHRAVQVLFESSITDALRNVMNNG